MFRRVLLTLALCVCAPAVLGCSDQNVAQPSSASVQQTDVHGYSVKLLVPDEHGVSQLVEIPAEERREAQAAPKGASSKDTELSVRRPGYRTQVRVDENGQVKSTDNGFSLRTLLGYASQACQYEAGVANVIPYGSQSDWYVLGFPSGARTCDEQLLYKENVLCIAEKLAEAADTVRPVVWDRSSATGDEVTIPPQATEDKFILRDLAINALANLASTDQFNIGGTYCRLAYQDVLDGTKTITQTKNTLFSLNTTTTPNTIKVVAKHGTSAVANGGYHTDLSPGVAVTDANATLLVEPRALLLNHINRAASRLLHDIVQKSVEADLAGAEKRRTGGDIAKMWGANSPDQVPYNSLWHALRVLYGRLEFDPWGRPPTGGPTTNESVSGIDHVYKGSFDPQCASVGTTASAGAEDVLAALGPGFSARWNDRPPKTTGEARAQALLEPTGLIIPPDSGDALAVRAAILDQLQINAAIDGGAPLSQGSPSQWDDALEDFRGSAQGAAIESLLGGLTDEELRFALDRNFDVYRILANREQFDPDNDVGGMGLSTGRLLSEKVKQLGGGVVYGGIGREDLAADPTAQLGSVIAASQCGATGGWFQDAFELANVFASFQVQGTSRLDEAAGLTRAESEAWLGIGRFYVKRQQLADGTPSLVAFLANVPSDALGTGRSDQSILDGFELIYGQPWEAACFAGIRTHCAGISESARWVAISGTVDSVDVQGHVDERFKDVGKTFTGSNLPILVSHGTPSDGRNFYAILTLGDGTKKIMGVARPGVTFASQATSPWREGLTDQIFGVGRRLARNDRCERTGSLGLPTSYCILGMERDMFVPVANELTSQSPDTEDSWKHYLGLAKEASAKADELGQKIIDLGLQRDLRRENAQEELAGICGSYAAAPDLQDLALSNTIDGDKSLQDCVGAPKIPVVFFGEQPSASDATSRVRQDYCAQITKADGICTTGHTLVAGTEFVGIGLTGAPTETGDDADMDCQGILGSSGFVSRWASGNFDADAFTYHAAKDVLSEPQQSVNIGRYRLIEGIDGVTWTLTVGGTPLMAMRSQQDLTTNTAYTSLATKGTSELGELAVYPVCKTLPSGWACHSDSGHCCNDLGKTVSETFNGVVFDGNALRRWLEGALWYMGAIAGRIPAGTYEIPLPVADFAQGTVAPPWMIYGKSRFVATGADSHGALFKLDPTRGETIPGEIAALSGIRNMPPGFANTRRNSTGLQSVKDFYEAAYTAPYGAYKIVVGQNEEIPFLRPGFPGAAPWLAQQAKAVRAGEGWPSGLFDDEQYRTCNVSGGLSLMQYGALLGEIHAWSNGCFAGTDYARLNTIVPEHNGKGGQDCGHIQAVGCADHNSPFIDEDCATSHDERVAVPRVSPPPGWTKGTSDYSNYGDYSNFNANILSPAWCGPDKRVQMFLDVPGDPAASLSLMAALSCLGSQSSIVQLGEPPVVHSVNDVKLLKAWLSAQAASLAKAQSQMFVVGIPQGVVDYFQKGAVPSGAVGDGTRGGQELQLAIALQDLSGGIHDIAGGFREAAAAVDAAALVLEGADLDNQKALANLAYQKIENVRQTYLNALDGTHGAIVSGMSTFGAGFVVGGERSLINNDAISQETEILLDLSAVQDAAYKNEVALAIQALVTNVASALDKVDDGISRVQTANLTALQTLNSLQQLERDARFEVAKAAGADFADIDGNGTPDQAMPVNTVYRRQYDILRRRYEQALDSAKRFSYLARLAIEQRLGVRLNELDENIGPMEPPSAWADDVCSLQGVNYEALRSADTGSNSAIPEEVIVQNFADQYIGDYVDKLGEFVEYYNIQYPFRESDDLAVVSLRDELVFGDGVCKRESRNLLFQSDSLGSGSSLSNTEDETSDLSVAGWTRSGCNAVTCLKVAGERYLDIGQGTATDGDESWKAVKPPQTGGNASLLIAASPGYTPAEEDLEVVRPPTSVYQSVRLKAGQRYRLSWWDMARGSQGQPASADRTYRVGVYTDTWAPVALQSPLAKVGGTNDTWSERRTLEFVAVSSGYYHVAFDPTGGTKTAGAIAIANVQLSEASGTNGDQDEYERTTSSRDVTLGGCGAGSPELFRSAFKHQCDEQGECFYELTKPIAIHESDLAAGVQDLNGVPAGNYNYRHLELALNVVGTGVLDCAGADDSCHANGFVEYDLEHSAFKAEVEDYGGTSRCFSFGQGGVRHGKALAAERFLGVPMGASDVSLIDQPAFMKEELRGRPVSGMYSLRIYDSPQLQWDEVEDIRVVLKHRYWSRVQRAPGD